MVTLNKNQQVGIIGLGKMGINIARNLLDQEIQVVGFDANDEAINELVKSGGVGASSLDRLLAQLNEKSIIWLMLPSGEITNNMIVELSTLVRKGSIIIDGGNSFYKDTLKNYKLLSENNIFFLDCGTSGGLEGARHGANLMIGGQYEIFKEVEWIFASLSADDGYLFTGPSGSGHYLKMVHNGIEYGMMQAIAEGFELLEASSYEYDYQDVCKLWNNGSVIRSWLLELAYEAFSNDPMLENVKGKVFSSGEGKWMVQDAIEREVSIPVITLSLLNRYRSLYPETFSDKLLALLRQQFGGHEVER